MKFTNLFFVLMLYSLPTPVRADLPAPPVVPIVGLWQMSDTVTGKPRYAVRITEQNGLFEGRIEKVLTDKSENISLHCDRCEGAHKNKPLVGLRILYSLKRHGQEYDDGYLLDPADGKVRDCRVWVRDSGSKLKVRGYTGLFFFRTHAWARIE